MLKIDKKRQKFVKLLNRKEETHPNSNQKIIFTYLYYFKKLLTNQSLIKV
jgi:hypothetical protein